MLFNTYKHTDLLGALCRYSVPTDCYIDTNVLSDRLYSVGLGMFRPSHRHRSDAMRLAIAEVCRKSKRVMQDGTSATMVIANLERKEGMTHQAWAVHQQVKDKYNQNVSYTSLGNILLYDDGHIFCPPALEETLEVPLLDMVHRYENLADHSKIRETIKKIVQHLGEPVPLNGLFFVASERIESLRSSLTSVFDHLPNGKVSVSIYEIAATPGNAQSLAQEMTESIETELGKIELGIAKAKEENEKLTKGVVADWLATIATLKANMKEMGVVNVSLPPNVSDLEKKLQDLKVELSKPKSKRVLAAL